MAIGDDQDSELQSIIASLNQLSDYDFIDLGDSQADIQSSYEIALGLKEPPSRPRVSASAPAERVEYDYLDLSQDFREPPEEKEEKWSLSLTDNFVKETKGIDRKLQGRILEALLDLVKAPMDARGDSCKPLTGQLAGLWRLRIGTTRLIYKPDPRMHRVYCLSFSSRGDAYR